MVGILADILSLIQYQQLVKEDTNPYRLEQCLCCGRANPHRHGGYPRKADRSGSNDRSLNPVYIQRYYCPSCEKTCSVLPECLPPHRWYLWEIQHIALSLLLAGKSLQATAQQIMPSRRTVGRWVNHFKQQLRFHKDVLCNHLADLGRTISFADFWQVCLSHFSLAQAMRLCHVAGVTVP
jgi:transposase-like protein